MYKLYNVKTWGSMSPHFILEEMGVPYQNIWLTAEQVRAPKFRDVSPLGQVPALGLDDGRAIFESAAIVTFLVTAHPDKGLAPQSATADFGMFLAWLQFMSANIYQIGNVSFAAAQFADTPEQADVVARKAADKTNDYYEIIEAKLKKEGPWMMGNDFSALDIYLFMLSLWARPSEAALHERFPEIARLATAVRARPMLKAAIEAHGVQQLGGYGG